jgi:MerR family transcriptional regulator, redox-sensitive transcriptional activator SoxR
LSVDTCPLRNPWDRLGAEGAGPRLLDPEMFQEKKVAR